MSDDKITYKIRITGLVQGVGFRPFIYRLAKEFELLGTVDNRNDGVIIYVSGAEKNIINFIELLPQKAPEASNIEDVKINKEVFFNFPDFRIVKSSNNAIKNEITEISPDIAVCQDCLTDMKSQAHRKGYSFINCTHCGPRFTIIRDLPYDRPMTTMESFSLCNICQKEYTDVNDRRFHAQPVACNNCGPHYTLHIDNTEVEVIDDILKLIAGKLESGGVIASKGIGGYNLICDALNIEATTKLRKSKHRDGKPLALMFKNEKVLLKYTEISKSELNFINSWRRPIVILKTDKFPNKMVTNGFNSIGALLPYMPFHYQLFERTKCEVLVYTSANLSGEPIIKDNDIALKLLGSEMPVLSYNRVIYNRVDDSVAFIANNTPRLIRRSRGYVPSPIRLHFSVDGILACGAELVNCFCIGRTSQAIISQHIGDLKNAETLEFYEESINRYKQLYKFEPKMIVCDLHPDYLSSRYADSQDLPIYKVQHHHAHMASVMAENNLSEKVIGIIMDGTGYGTDGKIWGGEYFIGNLVSFERFSHFAYIPIPGGDIAVKEPWRIALSYLYNAYGEDYKKLTIPFVKNMQTLKADLIVQLINKKLNCPESSAAGRLFDAVSALLELCSVSSFHAEAPMRLEDIIDEEERGIYNFDILDGKISFLNTIKDIVCDIDNNISKSKISTRFHNTIIEVSSEICQQIRKENHINKVVMSGGSFQNKYLSTHLENRLLDLGFEVYFHKQIPANDGGLALGQLAIGAFISQDKT